MLLVGIVQRTEGGEGYLGVTHIACFRFLLPELIGPAEAEQIVAADTLSWYYHASGWYRGECGKGLGYGIVCCADMV